VYPNYNTPLPPRAFQTGARSIPPLLAHALDYHNRGLTVFPLSDKQPAVTSWSPYRKPENRPDEDMLKDWFGRQAEHAENGGGWINGIAAITGPASGSLAVRDFDDQVSYRRWADEHQNLARALPTSRTGRGFHVWHRGPAIYRDLGDGEYIGTSRHCVACPPSYHPTARTIYEWLVRLPPNEGPLPEVDPIEAGLLPANAPADETRGRRTKRRRRQLCNGTTDIPALVAGCLPTGPGQRNDCILKLVRACDAAGVCREQLEDVFALWWEGAEAKVRDKRRSKNWRQFQDAWHRSQERLQRGDAGGCLGAVLALVDMVAVPDRWLQPASLAKVYRLCAAWHLHLQQSRHSTPVDTVTSVFHPPVFHLSCHLAGELANIAHVTAWRHLRTLEAAGVVVCVRRGDRGVGGDATEWKFAGESATDCQKLAA
jgi:hypothetical protein